MHLDASEILDAAMSICECLKGDHFDLQARIHCLSAVLKFELGISGRVEGLAGLQKSLRLRQQTIVCCADEVKRKDVLLFANALNDYGCALVDLESYEEAEPFFARSLEIKQQCGSENDIPFEFAESYKNIALVRTAQGRFAEAVELISRATELSESANGWRNTATLVFAFMKACICFRSGDQGNAIKTMERVHGESAGLLGEMANHTLNSRYVLGAFFHETGDTAQAK
jgi:tetratricopeptide (TPR) repeat protein